MPHMGATEVDTPNPVNYLVWYLTQACNLRCSYCYLEKKPLKSNSMVGRACIDFLLDQQPSGSHLRFFGGEPLIELDLLEEVSIYAKQRCRATGAKMTMDLVTNGSLLDREVRELLRILSIRAMVSLDGGMETMAKNRGLSRTIPGWKRFESNLRFSVDLGVINQFRMTVTPSQAQLADDLRFIRGFGPIPILLTTATNIPWTQQQIENIFAQIEVFYLEEARADRLPPLAETNRLLVTMAKKRSGAHTKGQHHGPFCQAGNQMLAVDTEGRFVLCHRMTHRLNEFSMGDIWSGINDATRTQFVELERDKFHHEMCDTCHARPYCVGSCMAANMDDTGDLFFPENRHCLDLRAHVSTVERILSAYDDERWTVITKLLAMEGEK